MAPGNGLPTLSPAPDLGRDLRTRTSAAISSTSGTGPACHPSQPSGGQASLKRVAAHVPQPGDADSLRGFVRQLWTLLDRMAEEEPGQYRQFVLDTADAAGADVASVESQLQQAGEATQQADLQCRGEAGSCSAAAAPDSMISASSIAAAGAAAKDAKSVCRPCQPGPSLRPAAPTVQCPSQHVRRWCPVE